MFKNVTEADFHLLVDDIFERMSLLEKWRAKGDENVRAAVVAVEAPRGASEVSAAAFQRFLAATEVSTAASEVLTAASEVSTAATEVSSTAAAACYESAAAGLVFEAAGQAFDAAGQVSMRTDEEGAGDGFGFDDEEAVADERIGFHLGKVDSVTIFPFTNFWCYRFAPLWNSYAGTKVCESVWGRRRSLGLLEKQHG